MFLNGLCIYSDIFYLSDNRSNFYSYVDTRTTQWEDPRLLNPQIAGPVCVYFLFSLFTRIVRLNKNLNYSLPFQAVPYSRDYKRKYEYLKSQLRKPVS